MHAFCHLAILTPKIHKCGKEDDLSRHSGLQVYSSPIQDCGVERHNLSSIDHGTFSGERLSPSLALHAHSRVKYLTETLYRVSSCT